MNYWLHPEAKEDLREAAGFYRDNGGAALSQSFLTEFERSVNLLLVYPRLGGLWRYGKRRLVMKHFPYAVIYTVA
jgi:plasmid stabilization system protein ParE